MADIKLLQSLLPGIPLRAYGETVSTNNDARAWLKEGAAHGSLVLADRQTGGRGRMGRAFASADGGLYMSLVIKSGLPAGTLTTLCAVAVRRAVAELTGLTLDIKWVNDLQYRGKKVCGILCEGVWEGKALLGVIAGIGLNVSQRDFPEVLRGIAASLYPRGGSPCGTEHFAAAIHRHVFMLLNTVPSHMAEYREACVTLGRAVRWQERGVWREGTAAAIDEDGALLIDTGTGTVRLAAGEVTLKTGD